MNYRVLHIIATVNPESGGPVQSIIQYLKAKNSCFDIETVSLDAPDSKFLENFPGVVHGVGPGISRYRYTPNLSNWIIDNAARFDAAVIHGLWNHASIGGWWGCRKSKLPYVIFSHGMMDPWFKSTYPIKHFAKQLFWSVQGLVLRDASEVLFTCQEEMSLASGVFWGYKYRPRVVSFAAEDVPQVSDNDVGLFYDSLPSLQQRPFLLFIGRVHYKKGCDLLIEGFSKVKKRPDLQLVIAGPDNSDYAKMLKNLSILWGVSDRIHWVGMIGGPIKSGAFRAAEAFILTSHQENFGIAVAEALAYGKPVLISNKVNIWREILEGGAGLVESDTVLGAINLIDSWELMSVFDRLEMSKNARAVYDNNFTIDSANHDLNAALIRAVESV
jgi:glycosyltransferase involved in cell wall biosynthesis